MENKLPVAFEFAGEQKVKNIAKAVRVFRVVSDATSGASSSTDRPLTLPDKPSIAVLPFDNLSGDADQDYLADGIAEDLITALSRIRWMFVTARNSSFAYKGQSPDVRQVGRELGVRYVLEGSVRKGGSRVRISAQLIDARVELDSTPGEGSVFTLRVPLARDLPEASARSAIRDAPLDAPLPGVDPGTDSGHEVARIRPGR